MSTLTRAQREVLKLLDSVGACATSRTTHHGYVSGATAAALARKGLARRLPATGTCDERFGITNEGRAAIRPAVIPLDVTLHKGGAITTSQFPAGVPPGQHDVTFRSVTLAKPARKRRAR